MARLHSRGALRLAFGELRKRWHCGRELARIGSRDPCQALEVLGGGGSKGAANRGLCFFVTRCGGYIVKQESSSTLRTLDNVAKTYAARASVQGSLLPRLVGAYTVRSNTTTTHWLVMANTFAGAPKIKAVYDVKGSTAGRRTRPKKGTLKDLDARDDAATLACHGSGEVVEALSGDTRVLEQLRLLDYSLLVGVCEPGLFGGWRAARYRRRDRGTRMLVCRDRGFLVVGLIDVLQPRGPGPRSRSVIVGRAAGLAADLRRAARFLQEALPGVRLPFRYIKVL